MRSKNGGYIVVVAVVVLVIGFVFVLTAVKAESPQTLPEDIKAILSDYSQFIETGNTSREADYSTQMTQLAAERRAYYQEFFSKGLHSDLVSLESQFFTDDGVTITQTVNTYYINITERVTLYGKPLTTSPDDYPLIQAAIWAVDQTSDMNVKSRLNQYISSMTKGVEESVNNGVQIVFSIKHNLEFRLENGQAIMLKDIFSDKSNDNGEGFDNVIWIENQFSRQEPDLYKMPDNEMYNVPIEVIGKQLLADNKDVATKSMAQISGYSSNRDHAVWYIREYTSNPDYYHYISCGIGNPSVLQDTDYYNPEYSSIWENTGCNDCADFVSQALHYGGYPVDNDWEPDLYNIYWVRPRRLGIYFDAIINRGSFVDHLTSLQVGDLAFIYEYLYQDEDLNWQHVAMVSKINPHRYSGHTNDRFDYAFSSDFNRFMTIMYDSLLYLPLVIKGDESFTPIDRGQEQTPYPGPSEYQDPSLPLPYPVP